MSSALRYSSIAASKWPRLISASPKSNAPKIRKPGSRGLNRIARSKVGLRLFVTAKGILGEARAPDRE